MKNNLIQTPIGKKLDELEKKVNRKQRVKKVQLFKEDVKWFWIILAANLASSVIYDLSKHLISELVK